MAAAVVTNDVNCAKCVISFPDSLRSLVRGDFLMDSFLSLQQGKGNYSLLGLVV